jgi:hypothetical protein
MSPGRIVTVLLAVSLVITGIGWPLAAVLWFSHGEMAFTVSVFFLGLSLGKMSAKLGGATPARLVQAG